MKNNVSYSVKMIHENVFTFVNTFLKWSHYLKPGHHILLL